MCLTLRKCWPAAPWLQQLGPSALHMLVMPVSDLWGLQKGQAVPDCNLCSALGEMASGGLLVIFTYEIRRLKDTTTHSHFRICRWYRTASRDLH